MAPLPWLPAWLRAVPAKMKAVNDEMQCPGPVGYVGLTLVFGIEVLLAGLANILVNALVNVCYLAVALPLRCCSAGGAAPAQAADTAAAPAEAAPAEP